MMASTDRTDAREDRDLKKPDTKAGAKNRGVGERGSPLLRVGGVPGYNKQEGTPGWIRKAADRAEGRSHRNLGNDGVANDGKESRGPHRINYDHGVGRPPYGKTAEVDPRAHTQGGDGVQRVKKGREAS